MAIERFDDLRARSRLGGVFYALSWLIIAAFGGAFAAYPLGSLLALALLAGLAVWRLRIPAARTAEDALRRERRLWQVILGSAALFGALATWALLDPAFRGVEIAILLCVISLGTAFAHVYAIDRRRALLGTGLISLPALFAEAVAGEHAVVTLVMAFHCLYLVGLVGQSHREYRARLALEEALRRERDRFEAQARTDALTGLANRRSFEFAQRRWLREPGGGEAWLAIVDIDHFKQVNDRHGHPVGDAALVRIATVLRDAVESSGGVAARLGGEEFGVLFRAGDAAAAVATVEALRMAVARTPLATAGGQQVELRVSAGLARLAGAEGEAYRRADAALYRAKAAGRDRVVIADDP